MSTTTWAAFAWPDWVPESVRREIESFWSEDLGRGPAAWEENARDRYNHSLPLGTPVLAVDRGLWFSGRFVHAWNNMGRVVRCTGKVDYVATYQVIRGPPLPETTTRAAPAATPEDAP